MLEEDPAASTPLIAKHTMAAQQGHDGVGVGEAGVGGGIVSNNLPNIYIYIYIHIYICVFFRKK